MDITNFIRDGITYPIGDVKSRESIATAFDSTTSYSTGDYVMYEGKLYECTTAITVPGAWVAANWTESKVMTSFQPISSSYISSLFS